MFRTSWVHPQGDSCVCGFTCIGVSSLVGRIVCSRHSPIHQTAHTNACETAYTAVSLMTKSQCTVKKYKKFIFYFLYTYRRLQSFSALASIDSLLNNGVGKIY